MKKIKELLKTKKPSEIITDYMEGTIFLTQRELQKVIDMKTGADIGRGSCNKWRGK